MQIESVRALKEEIASEVVPPAVAAIHDKGGFSITTFSLDKVTTAEPLLALGVAAGPQAGDVRLAVRLQRRSLQRSGELLETIRKRAHNEVDIRYVGRISKQAGPWYRSRLRPMRPGGSVAHYKVTAGTIGAFASHKSTGQTVILSNNHVIANENAAKVNDLILQPGTYDAGKRPKDEVARLTKWVPLLRNKTNYVDAAIATVKKSIEVDPLKYTGIGTLAGVRAGPVSLEMPVSKVGRTTGVTHGRVTAIELDDVVIEYDVGSISFDNQIEIESTGPRAFCSGGDSGSLILDENLCACGLLFAGSETGGTNGRGLTYANPIGPVLKKLAIKLLVS